VPEVILAIAFLAITFVSLLSVLAAGLRTDRKAFFRDAATSTARALLTKTLSKVSRDTPVGTKSAFWAEDKPNRGNPYLEDTVSAGDTVFTYQITTKTIPAANGSPFGGVKRRLKQVDIYVRWGGDDQRTGYGSTVYHDRRIISEASGDPL
jgi:hypothetical protein